MNRNLKALLAAAIALGALGAIGASAQAAELFHCSVEPCAYTLKPDGTPSTKTAHHVFILENEDTSESVSFTCPQLGGVGLTSAKASSELTLNNLNYEGECRLIGSTPLVAFMNGCDYRLSAAGQFTISCPGEEKIELFSELGCVYTIGPQAPVSGVSYHSIGTSPNREITMSLNLHGIEITADGTKAQCLIDPDQELKGTYTTGNTIITAEGVFGVMADGWWE